MRLGAIADAIETALAVASAATVYSKSWKWGSGEYFSLAYKATSEGVVGLKIELEQSNVAPTTERSSDDNYVVAENMQDVEPALATETQHYKKLSPVVSVYGRLKITGSGSNDASTTLAASIVRQEEL